MAPFLWRFLQQHCGIELSVICSDAQLSLGRGEADLAIRFTRQPVETLAGRRLSSVAFGIYASSDTAGCQFALANRAEWDWIGVHDDMHNRILFGSAFPEGQFKHRVDSVSALPSMARNGLGVTVLPCYIADRDEGLRRLEPDVLTDCSLDLWLLHHPDFRRVYRVRLFSEFIADLVRSDLELFEGRCPIL